MEKKCEWETPPKRKILTENDTCVVVLASYLPIEVFENIMCYKDEQRTEERSSNGHIS